MVQQLLQMAPHLPGGVRSGHKHHLVKRKSKGEVEGLIDLFLSLSICTSLIPLDIQIGIPDRCRKSPD
jgi:hypothetical protein